MFSFDFINQSAFDHQNAFCISDKYYTYVVDRLVKENKLNLVACDIQGHLWAEIDTSEDLLSLRQIEGD